MNGWIIVGIVYGSGALITFVLLLISMRGDEGVSLNEPGDDEAVVFIAVIVWPIVAIWFIWEVYPDVRRKLQARKNKKVKHGTR